jgi:flagellar basal body-associated protein FliL
MSRNLIIAAALVVVASLAIGMMLMSGTFSSKKDGATKKAEQLMAMLEQAGVDPQASHVRVKPFNVSIIQDSRVHGTLYVSMDLETGSRDLNAGVVKARPKLRDAYLQTLSRYADHQMNPNKPVNIMLLKKLLQRPTDRILGEGKVTVIVSAAHITKSNR